MKQDYLGLGYFTNLIVKHDKPHAKDFQGKFLTIIMQTLYA